MKIDTESKQYFQIVANEVLTQLGDIAALAKRKLTDGSAPGPNVFASINTMTSGAAVNRIDTISRSNRESYNILATEPAISRVIVRDQAGKEKTYYICRTTPLTGIPNLASYRSEVGRLAAWDVGSEFTMPNGSIVDVLESTKLRPKALADGWDSHDTVVETENFGPVTIESLRVLLKELGVKEVTEDILSQLLAEETVKANIIEGVRRGVITKMGLRDQPILDRHQDEIFRLPLNKRLMILGPPGTGKTTTLIRRLGQKLDAEFLDDDERRLVEPINAIQGLAHAQSWLMFTPTELLKQFLKEAFAREGVPASDHHIGTWQDYRRELARNRLDILRTTSGGGPFVLKEELACLTEVALDRPIQWFDDFNAWQRNKYLKELHEAAEMLREKASPEVQKIGEHLLDILIGAEKQDFTNTLKYLAAEIVTMQTLVTSLKDASDTKIKAALNLQLSHDRTFLDELARWIDTLQQPQAIEVDDQDDIDAEEEDETLAPRTGRTAAYNAYLQAVRAQARAVASKRTVSKTSRNGKIIDWLGDRGLTEADRAEVGPSLLIQSNVRRFVNPVKRYIGDIPRRYRAFRRERQQEDSWYCKEGFESRDLHPLELDIVLLTILRAAGDLIGRPEVLNDIDNPSWAPLRPFLYLYQNQILVDEATDFSPIQLACMAALAHPRLRSFFACGDFNQRLTTWGTRSQEETKWMFPDIDIKEITVSYRQSKQLNDLARAMILAVGGAEQNVTLPEHVDCLGVAPVLLENAGKTEAVVAWLAERIREIERFVGQLPSIAIFVNSEEAVSPLAEALNIALVEHNIPVIACHEGQAVGQESNVRIFDIQHIKGLEFEAVFFIGIDQLAALHPTLFEKYLYVGSTRAATYLGMTCNGILPTAFEGLRPHFGQHWQPSE